MSGRGTLARRSAAEWGTRGALALIFAVLGYLGVAYTLGYTLRTSDPVRAHALAPGDGRITALLAQTLSGPDATSADRIRADDFAREALLQDPTAVVAVSTLGLNAQIRGDTAGARRLFAYAEKLSRRHLQTQLWAVEDAVARGDVAGALRQYDTALRTSRSAPDLLFPILASAIAEPSVRAALTRTLASKPAWSDAFIQYAAGNGSDPRAAVQLFTGLRRAGVAVPPEAETRLVNALVARDHVGTAWSYYAATRPGADRRRSRDPHFTAGSESPSLFDWVPVNDSGISTSIQRGEQGGVFDFSVSASVGGPLLRQVQLLPPGDYEIEGRSIGIEQPRSTLPFWMLSCRDGRELGRVVVLNSAEGNGVFKGRFRVLPGCPVQTLTLVARPSDAVSGLSGQIDRVQLSPVR